MVYTMRKFMIWAVALLALLGFLGLLFALGAYLYPIAFLANAAHITLRIMYFVVASIVAFMLGSAWEAYNERQP